MGPRSAPHLSTVRLSHLMVSNSVVRGTPLCQAALSCSRRGCRSQVGSCRSFVLVNRFVSNGLHCLSNIWPGIPLLWGGTHYPGVIEGCSPYSIKRSGDGHVLPSGIASVASHVGAIGGLKLNTRCWLIPVLDVYSTLAERVCFR